MPIETPEVLRQRELRDGAAARRVFYYTSRFRQQAASERIAWHTEAFHRHFDGLARAGSDNGAFSKPPTSSLVADHPYFSGTGLGMGMTPNPTWGGYPLACDWFDIARRQAVDMIGIEDWMGLQYMYGPSTTWEGFQLMGFQAAIFRSGSRNTLPIMAWITPSDETNLRLKTASALCQGAKHFFYWTYGPTATSTENYWSDLRGAYDGVAAVTRQLAAAEHVLAPGRPRPTRVALLYSISSDLWQPWGYVHMLERRGLYLSLVHDQYLVDLLSEEDFEAGRLDDYDVLYTADPCLKQAAVDAIAAWVRRGGHLFGSAAAGSRNEFNEPVDGLAPVFGIAGSVTATVQPGRYHIRGALNELPYLDQIAIPAGPRCQVGGTWNQDRDHPDDRPSCRQVSGWNVCRRRKPVRPRTSDVRCRLPGHRLREGSPICAGRLAGEMACGHPQPDQSARPAAWRKTPGRTVARRGRGRRVRRTRGHGVGAGQLYLRADPGIENPAVRAAAREPGPVAGTRAPAVLGRESVWRRRRRRGFLCARLRH